MMGPALKRVVVDARARQTTTPFIPLRSDVVSSLRPLRPGGQERQAGMSVPVALLQRFSGSAIQD